MANIGGFNEFFSTSGYDIVSGGEGKTVKFATGDASDGGEYGGDDQYSAGSEEELIPPTGDASDGGDDGGDEEDSDGPKYVTSFHDASRASMGGTTDMRFKTPAEKAALKLALVFDTDYFSTTDRKLIKRLTETFSDRLHTFNLHTLAAAAVWIRDEKPVKEMKQYCAEMRIDAADLVRYQNIIKQGEKEKSKNK